MKKGKVVVKKPEVKKNKMFLAYDADTHTLIQGFETMDKLVAVYKNQSLDNSNLAWVAVETDVVSEYFLQNKLNIVKI